MTEYFVHDTYPQRIAFGRGAIRWLSKETAKLGVHRLCLISSAGQSAPAKAAAALHNAVVGHFAGAESHVPIEIAQACVDEVHRLDADATLCVGGGATIGLGKIVARELNLPQVAIPTTYSGSEMTPVWGLTEDGVKHTARDHKVLPRVVIYDPELTKSLPPGVSAVSGINAIAHAVEAMYAADANPMTSLMASESVRALAGGLPAVMAEPFSVDARERALFGLWLAGAALAATLMGLHHIICHVLGGAFNLPHASTHTVVLPHTAAYNHAAAPQAMTRIAEALGAASAPQGLYELIGTLGAPKSLQELGLPAAALDSVAATVAEQEYANPAPVTAEGVRTLLENAWHGRPLAA